ncbi:hypothetical protein [Aerosakkonema funiforme]|uniref:Uncharacterized protein n=1 Tax=Aerosakkonema funiforme FACHB-1375 TaxID=2949571 RepID=A0A926VK90_9CYAN|nr:hypothetical protein [Aerosakkonema funiforme]MBD2185432.1 hypothetical protein [Aerosakkonema funiforme FACHB-1375]
MDIQKYYLAENMALLLSISPNSNLAKLLRFCLAIGWDEKVAGKSTIEIVRDLMENPSNLPYWTREVMGMDREHSDEEWIALGEMGIKDAKEFMNTVWQELENLQL